MYNDLKKALVGRLFKMELNADLNSLKPSKYQVLARRYRPQKFSDVVGQQAVITTLKNALRFDKVAHAYLFSGSRGIGKTTLARLFAKALNCQDLSADFEPCGACSSCLDISGGQSLDVIEIDGASNRGIDDIRQINETITYAPSHGRFKIYIIDEVHMLTKEAFNALLKTLEEPPEKAKFFFATTEAHKVLPTILSRCQRFDLNRLQLSEMIEKLEEIAKDLNRKVQIEALHLIASFSEGSLRDAESLLDQLFCFSEEEITEERVRDMLGLVSQNVFFSLDEAFSSSDLSFAFDLVEKIYQAGKDLTHFLSMLIEHYRNLVLLKTLGEKALNLPQETLSLYQKSLSLYSASQTLYALEYLLKQEPIFTKSTFPRISMESILLHLIRSKHRVPPEILTRKLVELENALLSASSKEPIPFETTSPRKSPPPSPAKASEPSVKEPQKENEKISLKEVPFMKVADESVPEPPPKSALPPSEISPPEQVLEHTLPLQEKTFSTPPPKEPLKNLSPSDTMKSEKSESISKHHPSHYDTLMRFAQVELEGSFKKGG